LKETPFQIKSGEAASLTLHNICDVNDENDCTQRWEVDINNQLGGETCFAADLSSRSWSNLEAEVSYLMNFELIPFVNFVSGVIAQGFVEQTDKDWGPIDVDNYLLGETVYINVRIENAEIMNTEYLILYVENSRFKLFGNLADTQAAGHLELQGVKSDLNMRYQFAIHEHVFSTEETRLDARLIIGIAVNPNNGVFSGSSIVHEFETSFVVSMIVCKEPYSDIPAVPGTLVLVPCDEGDGEWLAYCDVTGWDLDQSEGRSNCASSVTISSSLAPQKQQIGVPWWVWIALIVAAIILCILFGAFGGARERVTEYYHSRYKEGYQRRSRGANYHGGFFGYFGGTSYGDPRRGRKSARESRRVQSSFYDPEGYDTGRMSTMSARESGFHEMDIDNRLMSPEFGWNDQDQGRQSARRSRRSNRHSTYGGRQSLAAPRQSHSRRSRSRQSTRRSVARMSGMGPRRSGRGRQSSRYHDGGLYE